jgi:hypothetical protein
MRIFPSPGLSACRILLFLCLSATTVTAQESYFSLGVAAATGVNGITHPMFEESSINGTVVTTTAKTLTLGSGFNYRGEFSYFFNEHIGIGLQGSLIRGRAQQFASERKIVYVQYLKQSVRCNGFSIAAALHARVHNPYVSPFFSVIPGFFSGYLEIHDTVIYHESTTTSLWKYTGMGSAFVSFATGADFHLSDRIHLSLQVEYKTLTVAPSGGRLILRNGSDDLEQIPVREKRILFVDQYESDYTQIPDNNLPAKVLKPYFPIDNLQLRIGIRVKLDG